MALSMIQQLYAVEREAKEQGLDVAAIKELRLKDSLPVINELGNRGAGAMDIRANKKHASKEPNWKSDAIQLRPLGCAKRISVRWKSVDRQQPNRKRHSPFGPGQKKLPPGGSVIRRIPRCCTTCCHDLLFFAICKKHSINPFNWLKHTLQNICTINHKHITSLYPQNFNKIPELINM